MLHLGRRAHGICGASCYGGGKKSTEVPFPCPSLPPRAQEQQVQIFKGLLPALPPPVSGTIGHRMLPFSCEGPRDSAAIAKQPVLELQSQPGLSKRMQSITPVVFLTDVSRVTKQINNIAVLCTPPIYQWDWLPIYLLWRENISTCSLKIERFNKRTSTRLSEIICHKIKNGKTSYLKLRSLTIYSETCWHRPPSPVKEVSWKSRLFKLSDGVCCPSSQTQTMTVVYVN